jgi:fluoride exporter
MLQRLILIGLAGLAGTLCRYGLSGFVARRLGETFPTGTLLVNIIGCFVAGFLLYTMNERFLISEIVRTAVMIGFLGGFTTFSSFGVQTFTLLREGETFFAVMNVLLSNVIGIVGVWVGYSFAKVTGV